MTMARGSRIPLPDLLLSRRPQRRCTPLVIICVCLPNASVARSGVAGVVRVWPCRGGGHGVQPELGRWQVKGAAGRARWRAHRMRAELRGDDGIDRPRAADRWCHWQRVTRRELLRLRSGARRRLIGPPRSEGTHRGSRHETGTVAGYQRRTVLWPWTAAVDLGEPANQDRRWRFGWDLGSEPRLRGRQLAAEPPISRSPQVPRLPAWR